MPLEYIALFEELLEITSKIIVNTVSHKIKQELADTTQRIINDITFVLQYAHENGYEISKGKEFFIRVIIQNHQKQLIRLIEQQSIFKRCSKCGKRFPRTHTYFYRDCNAKDGLRNDCKQCHKTAKKELYHQHKIRSENFAPTKDEEGVISKEYEKIIQE
ncbi:MAG: hypothetical protein ACFFFT_00010 [Candidatus Thorarchaeota archaeon]